MLHQSFRDDRGVTYAVCRLPLGLLDWSIAPQLLILDGRRTRKSTVHSVIDGPIHSTDRQSFRLQMSYRYLYSIQFPSSKKFVVPVKKQFFRGVYTSQVNYSSMRLLSLLSASGAFSVALAQVTAWGQCGYTKMSQRGRALIKI
jgi:hypothetical protein